MNELKRPRIAPLALLVVVVVGLWSFWVSGEVALTEQSAAPSAAPVGLIEQNRECPFRTHAAHSVETRGTDHSTRARA